MNTDADGYVLKKNHLATIKQTGFVVAWNNKKSLCYPVCGMGMSKGMPFYYVKEYGEHIAIHQPKFHGELQILNVPYEDMIVKNNNEYELREPLSLSMWARILYLRELPLQSTSNIKFEDIKECKPSNRNLSSNYPIYLTFVCCIGLYKFFDSMHKKRKTMIATSEGTKP